jgi:hypothetical protein
MPTWGRRDATGAGPLAQVERARQTILGRAIRPVLLGDTGPRLAAAYETRPDQPGFHAITYRGAAVLASILIWLQQ